MVSVCVRKALTRKPVWLFGDLCLENVQNIFAKGFEGVGLDLCVRRENIG